MDSGKTSSWPARWRPNVEAPATRKIEPSDPVYNVSKLAEDLGGDMDSRKVAEIFYQLHGPSAL